MLMLPIWLSAQTGTGAKKLTEEDRIELLRGLGSEFATVRAFLPRSQRPLPFPSDGNYDKEKWQEMGRQMGAAARVGDQVQITRVGIMSNRVEHASASPARIQRANKINTAAGIIRQSTPVPNSRGLPCWSNSTMARLP